MDAGLTLARAHSGMATEHPLPNLRIDPPCAIGTGRPAPENGWPLHRVATIRQHEAGAAGVLPPHTLMRRAGLATARLAIAVAPQARRVWVAAGPGNNGGDGLEAALHLHRAGKDVTVGLVAAGPAPPDASAALERARAAGVRIVAAGGRPENLGANDLAIDALLGIGLTRAPAGPIRSEIEALNAGPAPVLAVDLPSGLGADLGTCFDALGTVRARWTLSLLCLKPGLFTAEGRDHCGEVWFDDLAVACNDAAPSARLLTEGRALWPARCHVQHKGSFGDVWVVGGAAGMAGAALLAARAALVAGAGRVYLVPLDPHLPRIDPSRPELMHRDLRQLRDPAAALEQATVVCGCGGGDAIRELLPLVIARAGRLLLDADALNALAGDAALPPLLAARSARGRPTIMTPHPLEAGRLLGTSAASVQADRLSAAGALARLQDTVVVLKGSGTVIVEAGGTPWINASGNAALASAGTGDVLAGWLGGLWAQGLEPTAAARLAVHSHGAAADNWTGGDRFRGPMTASDLVDALGRTHRR